MTAPKFAKHTRNGRMYDIPGLPQPVPSVTNVIRTMAAPALEKWKRERVAEAAVMTQDWRVMDAETAQEMILSAANGNARSAAARGTDIHALIERGETGTPEQQPYLDAAAAVVAQVGELWKAEVTLVNTVEGYAGTADALHWADGDYLLVLDWKTVGEGKSVGWDSHILQLAALSRCDSWVDDEGALHPMPGCSEIAVAGLRPDGTHDLKWTNNLQRIDHAYQAFLGLHEAKHFVDSYPWMTFWDEADD